MTRRDSFNQQRALAIFDALDTEFPDPMIAGLAKAGWGAVVVVDPVSLLECGDDEDG